NHPVATLISHELADEIRDLVDSDSYRVTGSPGRGNWAETPWVSVFDRLVTDTAQRGFYIVYLLRGDGTAATYDSPALPPEEKLKTDLDRMLLIYATLVQASDALVEDADPAAVEAAAEAGIEAMKERWHKRSERNPKLAKAAKEYH